eukprot:GHVL01011035.1.p1 GENE.GHVL01011035.1~~GHVL01011035.1.p1  ORF type:complete len:1876 (-),score=234.06 GHVL01011035.1:173-5194(-)
MPVSEEDTIVIGNGECDAITIVRTVKISRGSVSGRPKFDFITSGTLSGGIFNICLKKVNANNTLVGTLAVVPSPSAEIPVCTSGFCEFIPVDYGLPDPSDGAVTTIDDSCPPTSRLVHSRVPPTQSKFIFSNFVGDSHLSGDRTICYCLRCNSDILSDYIYKLGNILRVNVINPLNTDHTCVAGEAICRIAYQTYSHLDSDMAFLNIAPCTVVTTETLDKLIGPVSVELEDGMGVFKFEGQADTAVGVYNVCWCDGDENNPCPISPTLEEANTRYNVSIGLVTIIPKPVENLIDCHDDCIVKFETFNDPFRTNKSIVVFGETCDGIMEVNIAHYPISSVNSVINLKRIQEPLYFGEYSLCWCAFTCVGGYVRFKHKLAKLRLKFPFTPERLHHTCISGDNCELVYPLYADFNINDLVSFVPPNLGCSDFKSSDVLAYSAVSKPQTPTFILPESVGVGRYNICFCSGSESRCDILPDSLFRYSAGVVVKLPQATTDIVDCTSGQCSITPSVYTLPQPTNRVIVSQDEDCLGHDNIYHDTVAPIGGSFLLNSFLIESGRVHSVCWCYDNCDILYNFSHLIGKVRLMLPEVPKFGTYPCAVTADNQRCVLEYEPYQKLNSENRAMLTNDGTCGATDGFSRSDVDDTSENATYTFSLPSRSFGTFLVCWCSGETSTCTGFSDFSTRIGEVILHPSVTPQSTCNRTCDVRPLWYINPSEEDRVILVMGDVVTAESIVGSPVKPDLATFSIPNPENSFIIHNIFWCYKCGNNELEYEKYKSKIGTAVFLLASPPDSINHTCIAGDSICSLRYPYFFSSQIGDAVIVVMTEQDCDNLDETSILISYSRVTKYAYEPTYIMNNQETVPLGDYMICWCTSADFNKCSKPDNITKNIHSFNYNIGTLTRYPGDSRILAECTSGGICEYIPSNYPGPLARNVAYLTNSDCSNTATIIHAETSAQMSSFLFSSFVPGSISGGRKGVCWRMDQFNDTHLIGYLQLSQSSISPYIDDYECIAGTLQCVLSLRSFYTSYERNTILLVQSTSRCGYLNDEDVIIDYASVTAVLHSPPFFIFSAMSNAPVGSYLICFCTGRNQICPTDKSISFANREYNTYSGLLEQVPMQSLRPVMCEESTISECRLKPEAYPSPNGDDLALVVIGSSCSVDAVVDHSPLTELNGEFIFTSFISFESLHVRSACFCSKDCVIGTNTINMAAYHTYIGNIVRLDPNPTTLSTIVCIAGINICPQVQFSRSGSQSDKDELLLVKTTQECGRLEEDANILHVTNVEYTYTQSTYRFNKQSLVGVGNYLLCRCEGGADLCDLRGISTRVEYANIHYINHVGSVLRAPSLVVGTISCSTSCSINPEFYPEPGMNDAALVTSDECGSISNVLHLPVLQNNGMFVFGSFSSFHTEALNVCWGYNVENISNLNYFTVKIGTVTRYPVVVLPPLPTASLTKCQVSSSQSCTVAFQDYQHFSESDQAIITLASCDNVSNIFSSSTVRVSTSDFIFTMSEMSVGTFNVCFCKQLEKGCNLPSEIGNFSDNIGELLYYPGKNSEEACSTNNCLVKIPTSLYPNPASNDRCLLVNSSNTCDSLTDVSNAIRSEPVTSSGTDNNFLFNIPATYETDGQLRVCWCDGKTSTCDVASITDFGAEIGSIQVTTPESHANIIKYSFLLSVGALWIQI